MISRVWIPLVSPVEDGGTDLASDRKLVDYYIKAGAAGMFPLCTTGEAPTLDDIEVDEIIVTTIEAVDGRMPVLFGAGGNATAKVVRQIHRMDHYDVQGFVSVCLTTTGRPRTECANTLQRSRMPQIVKY